VAAVRGLSLIGSGTHIDWERYMTGFFSGPSLLVHILIIAMVNAFFFPLFATWSGSILYAFLISVATLCIYGLLAIWLHGRRKR
jgi:hypothetical protein